MFTMFVISVNKPTLFVSNFKQVKNALMIDEYKHQGKKANERNITTTLFKAFEV